LDISKGNILDYGCGIGTDLKFFQQLGFTPFGVDIVPEAIKKTKLALPKFEENFHTIPNIPNLKDYFHETFDIIFANQVMYYLNDKDIENICNQFFNLLKPGGIFFVTMISTTNGHYKFIESTKNNLSKVVLKQRLNEIHFMNFKTSQQVLDIFKKFEKLHLGSYEMTMIESEGSTAHHIFIGKK